MPPFLAETKATGQGRFADGAGHWEKISSHRLSMRQGGDHEGKPGKAQHQGHDCKCKRDQGTMNSEPIRASLGTMSLTYVAKGRLPPYNPWNRLKK